MEPLDLICRDKSETFDELDARLDAVDARIQTLEVIAETNAIFRRTIVTLVTAQTETGGQINELSMFQRQLAEFGDRLSGMLAQAAQARTQELERWLRIEERLRNP